MNPTRIIHCDFQNPAHREAIKNLMHDYMLDPMGNHPVHTPELAEKMVKGLEEHPSKLVILAKHHDIFVGLANCFINFATFSVKKFINIHDLVVLKQYRGLGIGKTLMEAIIAHGKSLDCSKITLEVRDDNKKAQALYKSLGFEEGQPLMHYWTKYLD